MEQRESQRRERKAQLEEQKRKKEEEKLVSLHELFLYHHFSASIYSFLQCI